MFRLKKTKVLNNTTLSNCYHHVTTKGIPIIIGVDKYHPRYCPYYRRCSTTHIDPNNSAIFKKYC